MRQTPSTAEKSLANYWQQLKQQGVPIFALFWNPVGAAYAWPQATLFKPQNYIPSVRFRMQNGDPHCLPMAGGSIHEVPMYWRLVEEYGKLPWSATAASLRPPAIGSPAFAFDGETGAAYASKDLYL